MRKWLCITAIFLSLLSSGCIKASPVLVIKDDGSGTFDANYSISEASINQFRAMFKLKQQMAVNTDAPLAPDDDIIAIITDPTEEAIKAKAEKYKDIGLTLDRLKIQSRNAWRFVEMRFSFSDIKKLESADFFAKHGFNLAKRHDGSYTFEKPAAKAKSQARSTPAGDLAVIAPLMAGFSLKFKLEFPGRLIDTNAHGKGLYSATWSFDFDSDADALTKLQEQSFQAIFEGKGLKIQDVKIKQDAGAKPPAGKS